MNSEDRFIYIEYAASAHDLDSLRIAIHRYDLSNKDLSRIFEIACLDGCYPMAKLVLDESNFDPSKDTSTHSAYFFRLVMMMLMHYSFENTANSFNENRHRLRDKIAKSIIKSQKVNVQGLIDISSLLLCHINMLNQIRECYTGFDQRIFKVLEAIMNVKLEDILHEDSLIYEP